MNLPSNSQTGVRKKKQKQKTHHTDYTTVAKSNATQDEWKKMIEVKA